MARPQKDGMDYFPHDTDAANDEKVEALRSLYGNDGYAFYFIMLERIYRTSTFELDVSDAETREETFQILARKVAVTEQKFQQMLQTAFKWGCFDRDIYENQGIITSQGVKKRAGVVLEKREFMRLRYFKTKEKVSDAETTPETMEETLQSKVKKSKEKKSINNTTPKIKYAESVTLTEVEHTKLITEYGEQDTKRLIEILDNYKLSSGKKYKSDYHAILNWVVKRLTEEKNHAPKVDKQSQVKNPTQPNKFDNLYL